MISESFPNQRNSTLDFIMKSLELLVIKLTSCVIIAQIEVQRFCKLFFPSCWKAIAFCPAVPETLSMQELITFAKFSCKIFSLVNIFFPHIQC